LSTAIRLAAAAAAAATPGQNIVVIVDRSGPAPAPWIGWAIGASLLIGVAVTVRRRAAKQDSETPHRVVRILVSALAGSSVVTLMLAPQQFRELSDIPFAVPFALALFSRLLALTAFGFALVAVPDLVLDYFHPRRTRIWLMIAPPLFIALTLGFIVASGVDDSFHIFSEAGYPVLVPAGGAAGLIWWSWLPAPHSRLVGVFE